MGGGGGGEREEGREGIIYKENQVVAACHIFRRASAVIRSVSV